MMKIKTLLLGALMGMFNPGFSQTDPYQLNQNEIAFPSEVAKTCFGIQRTDAYLVQIEQGTGHVGINRSYPGEQIQIGNKKYEKGLGIFTTSSLLVHLAKPASRFCAEVGLDNNAKSRSGSSCKVVFSIETKEKVLWNSGPLGFDDPAMAVDIPLKGVTEFYLNVKSIDARDRGCQADWANAFVVYGKNEKVGLDEYFSKTSVFKEIPLSFVLNGVSSRNFLNNWNYSVSDSLAPDRIVHKIKWVKPDGTFEVRCLLTEFTKHPVIEWKLFFRNTGTTNSPMLEKVLPLDNDVYEPARLFSNIEHGKAILHCNKGSSNSNIDFMPVDLTLERDSSYQIYSSREGRPSVAYLPFWNLEFHRSGLVTALGWSGDWKANFSQPASDRIRMQAGMANCKLYLKPGEEISSPSVCLLYWEGDDPLRGNNLFRRYMLNEVSPKWNGKEPVCYSMSGGSSALETVNEKNQLDYIRKIAGTGAEIYWLDAGWYAGPKGGEWSSGRGNWFPDPEKFPNGMKILADEAHKNGLKFLLWFDPEAVCPNTMIAREHPEWVIWRKNDEGKTGLYNLGNPQALNYMTDLISNHLKEWEVDVYRNDFNIDPGPLWKSADEPGRAGMTEIRYVEGLYAFWGQLLKRKPDLLIDNCASGGRRIDYETCKLSVPLWRSDYNCDLYPDLYEANQNQTYGLEMYLPYSSCGQSVTYDKYKDRSISTCSVVLSIGASKPEDLAVVPFDKVKHVWDDLKSYAYLMKYDFYPLSEFSLSNKSNVVFQFNNPATNEGCVICYRRNDSPYPETELILKAIDPQASYKIIDIDSGIEKIEKGSELVKLSVKLNRLESKVIKYLKIK